MGFFRFWSKDVDFQTSQYFIHRAIILGLNYLNLHEASWKLGHRVENSKAAGNERRRSKTEMSGCKFCQNSSFIVCCCHNCNMDPTFSSHTHDVTRRMYTGLTEIF